MPTIDRQHILYPLISLLTGALAYAGQGLLEAQAPKERSPIAITTIAILFIWVKFKAKYV